jgi:hypothetical protein
MHDRARLVLQGHRLTRKAGWFWRKSIDLREVRRIEARNVDALTADMLWIVFTDEWGRHLSISEGDQDFLPVTGALAPRFPGIAEFDSASPSEPLQATRLVLWQDEVVKG